MGHDNAEGVMNHLVYFYRETLVGFAIWCTFRNFIDQVIMEVEKRREDNMYNALAKVALDYPMKSTG